MGHHGKEDLKELSPMIKELKEYQEKIAGTYPDNKLVESDEGALAFSIGVIDRKVILTFPEPVAWMGMTGDQAMNLAQMLIKRAREAGHTKPFIIEI